MRRVLRIAAVVAGVVALLMVAAVVVPALIDWRPYAEDLAADVRAATGHDLVLAGDLDVRVLPRPRVTATEIRLVPPAGGAPLASVARLRMDVRLWPLLRGAVAVEELSVDAPHLDLAVDAAGRPNWRTHAAAAGTDAALPELSIAVARVRDGEIRFADARSGRRVAASAIAVDATLPGLAAPLHAAGALDLDGRPVALSASLATPAALLAGEAAALSTDWRGPLFEIAFNGRVGGERALAGGLTATVSSLGDLAAWLAAPLPADPGRLTLSARAEVGPEAGTLTGLALALPDADVRVGGAVRWGDGLPQLNLTVATGVLDLDPYVPPTNAAEADDWAWFDAPLDLSAAAGFNAVVRLASAGARLGEATFGRIDAVVTARDGAFAARVTEVGLRGGTGRGSVSLGTTEEGVQAHAAITVDRVALAELVARLTGGATAEQGTVSGEVDVAAAGATPRALLADLSGRVAIGLGGDAATADADALTRLRLDARFSGAVAGPRATASAVYRGEAVEARLTMGPLADVLAGARFPLEIEAASRLGRFAYDGDVLQRPVPSLDGTLSASAPALGELWAWLDRPLDLEPGPFRARLDLVSDGDTGTIENTALSVGDFTLDAAGDFDARGAVPAYRLDLRGGVLDLDEIRTAFAGDDDAAADADWLQAPLDLTPLRARSVDLGVTLAGVKLGGVESGEVRLTSSLTDSRLDAALAPVDWGGARLDARLEVDAATAEAAARLRGGLEAPSADALPEAMELDDRLSGAIVAAFDVATAGGSVAGLLDGLDGSAEFQFDSFSFAEEELGQLDEVAVTVAFDPDDGVGAIEATVVGDWQPPGNDLARPAELRATVAPATALLGAEPVPLEATLVLGDACFGANGTVAEPFGDLDPAFDVTIEATTLADFDALAEDQLPPIGPVSATARMSRDGEAIQFDAFEAAIGTTTATGDVTLYPAASPFALKATLDADLIDFFEIPDAYWDLRTAAMAEDPRMFPATPFNLNKLSKADLALDAEIGEIRSPRGYDIDAIAVSLAIVGGYLDAVIEYDTVFGGRAATFVRLDARGDTPEVNWQMEFADEDFGEMLAAWALFGQATGTASTSFELSARGDSARDWAATLNGDFELKVGDGEFNDDFMGAFAVGLDDAFRPLLGGESGTRLNCLVIRLEFEDGVGRLEPLLLHTSSFYAVGQGTIDLRDETIEARIDTGTDKISLTRFALPLRVSGSLKETKVETIKTSGRSLMIVGSVVGTVLMPLPAIGAMVAGEVVDGSSDPCGEALDALVRRGQPVPEPAATAPPPPVAE